MLRRRREAGRAALSCLKSIKWSPNKTLRSFPGNQLQDQKIWARQSLMRRCRRKNRRLLSVKTSETKRQRRPLRQKVSSNLSHKTSKVSTSSASRDRPRRPRRLQLNKFRLKNKSLPRDPNRRKRIRSRHQSRRTMKLGRRLREVLEVEVPGKLTSRVRALPSPN